MEADNQNNQQILESIAEEELNEEEEIEYANQLAEARNIELNRAEEIDNEGRAFGKPSWIRYFVLIFVFAIPNDIVDAVEITGFGIIFSWIISIFLSVASIIFAWFTDQEQKRTQEYVKKLEAVQASIVRTSKGVLRVTKFFKKNPTAKLAAGAIAELIPLLSMIPWSTVAAIWAYMDERSNYKQARTAGQDVSSQISEAASEMV